MLAFAIGSILMLSAVLGLAVDLGNVFQEQRRAQDTADAAARVGGAQIDLPAWLAGDGTTAPLDPTAAEAAVDSFLSGVGITTFQATASTDEVTVEISRDIGFVFLRVIGWDTVTVTARATATGQVGGGP